jgi:hypothetical protein
MNTVTGKTSERGDFSGEIKSNHGTSNMETATKIKYYSRCKQQDKDIYKS